MIKSTLFRAIRHFCVYSTTTELLRIREHTVSVYYNLLHKIYPNQYSDSKPFRPIYIDPNSLTQDLANHHYPEIKSTWKLENHLSLGRFKPFYKRDLYNSVIKGNWDQSNEYFNDRYLYKSIKNRFENGVDWKETPIYKKTKEYLLEDNARVVKGFNIDKLDKRFQQIDNLYSKINSDGFVSQSELNNGVFPYLDEIKVAIGRNGELIYDTDGAHRLSIAKILDLDRIPVIPMVRHPEWQKKRDQIRKADTESDIPTEIIEYVSHPDMVGLINSPPPKHSL